ncbi:class I SAM-dependent methyltransferase [Paraburkholderia fungorum]
MNLHNLEPRRVTTPHSWLGHIPFAIWLVEFVKPRAIVELGVHTGNSFFAFCQGVSQAGLDTRVFGVDTWAGDSHAGFYEEQIYREVAEYNSANYASQATLLRMTFDDALKQVADATIDLLHIDGLHTYNAVKHDFETWLPKLSDRAVVLFHDTEVKRDNFGVHRFWDEIVQTYPGFRFHHSNGLGVLFVGQNVPAEFIELFKDCSEEGLKQNMHNFFTVAGERLEFRHGQSSVNTLRNGQLRETQTKIYWAGPDGEMSEQWSAAAPLVIGGGWQTVRVVLDVESPVSLRLDLTDWPSALHLGDAKILAADGSMLWRWDGEAPLLSGMVELQPFASSDPDVRLFLVAQGFDPRGTLALAADILDKIRPGCVLSISLDARPLSAFASLNQ